jgi:hypothetical protein
VHQSPASRDVATFRWYLPSFDKRSTSAMEMQKWKASGPYGGQVKNKDDDNSQTQADKVRTRRGTEST